MAFRKALTGLLPVIGMAAALTVQAQQKPFTLEQVSNLVKAGLGDEAGAKLIRERGIEFKPGDDDLQRLRAAGASDAFIAALRSANPPAAATEKPPLNQVQIFSLLVGKVPNTRVAMLIRDRGINFDPTNEYLEEVRVAGGDDFVVAALIAAKVTKPVTVDPAQAGRQAEMRKHVARGAELFRGKHYADAEAEYRAAIRLDPQNPDLLDSLGATLSWKEDWDGAIEAYREAIRIRPGDDRAHGGLGVALGVKGDVDAKIAEEREAIRLNPSNDEAHTNLGDALGLKGDLDGEIEEQRAALRLNPQNDNAHAGLGYAFGMKGNEADEIREDQEALRLNPNSDAAHNDLGTVYGNRGDLVTAAKEFREAIRVNPNVAMVHYNLGMTLERQGDRQGALDEYHKAVILEPANAQFKKDYERLLGMRR